MTLPRRLLHEIRSLDEYDLRRLMVFVGEIVAVKAGDVPAFGSGAPTPTRPKRVSYRRQLVRCGKAGCATCPHGPYWYAFWREAGRVRTRYVGKELPAPETSPKG